jgi:hypothetical protein
LTETAGVGGVNVVGSNLPNASAGFCLVSFCACDFERGLSAMEGVAEKTIKPASSEDAIIALLPKNDFIGRVSCPM